ncbi:MAG: type II toxin-antitoxin system Phd/YefM family antitoxin [Candidatus Eremiobacterota bacterium]
MQSFSIAEARHNLASLVHAVEQGPIELTRRGKPVAVLMSQEEYRRLVSSRTNWWDAVMQWRESNHFIGEGLTREEVDSWRDPGGGRDFRFED